MNIIRFLNNLYPPIQKGGVVEPIQDLCSVVIHPPTPMTEAEKLVIDKLYKLLETNKVAIKGTCYYSYEIIIDNSTFVSVGSCFVKINDGTSLLSNPSDEARVELRKIENIIEKRVNQEKKERNQEQIDKFLKL